MTEKPTVPGRRLLGQRCLAIALGLLAALCMDFGVRQIYLRVRKKPPKDLHPLRIAHPVLHHGISPNAQGVDVYGPYSAPYFSNSFGLRDSRIRELPAQGERPRILFMGDSFTEAGPIPWEKTFVGRVAAALEPRGIEVLNGGVASYCPLIQKVRLEDLLKRQGLSVNQVVLCLDISDIKDQLYYELDAKGAVRAVPYGPFHDRAESLGKIDATCAWLEQNIEKNFVILGAIVRNARLQWRRHSSRTGVQAYDEIPVWAYGWPDYRGPHEKFVTEGLARAQRDMSDIARFLRERGIGLTVVVYPWPQQVRTGSKPSRVETEWSQWAKNNGAQFISLFPVFVNTTPAEEILSRYYWKNDAHWNEEGHRLVAEALLDPQRGIHLPKAAKR